MVRTVLASRIAMVLHSGPEHVQIGNDAYLASDMEAAALQGKPARAVWADMAGEPGSRARPAEAVTYEDRQRIRARNGSLEECYFTCSQSPLFDDDGAVAGILSTSIETTARVLAERRMRTLSMLAESATGASTANEACTRAARALAENPHDVAVALIYLIDRSRPRPAACSPRPSRRRMSSTSTPTLSSGRSPAPWPLRPRSGWTT
jgi:hypothetical protein